ncbi:dehydratase [Diaphorobacter sp. HDW4A]|uniref:dehydratase n=1 Tax=Diaphorobacter sp. HDW4A TaxID=2714924 RepID=UPI00197ED3D9|nr:dehydratase [Diaphorobacter sp. HDW4A]
MLEATAHFNRQEVDAGYRFSRQHGFDEDQVKRFALMAGDHDPTQQDLPHDLLHASGAYITALLMGLASSQLAQEGRVQGMNYSMDMLRPVFATEKVTLEWVVSSRTRHLEGGWILELEGNAHGPDQLPRVLAIGRVLFTPWSVDSRRDLSDIDVANLDADSP